MGSHIKPNEWMGPRALRSARVRMGLSRAEAAAELNISSEMWRKMEDGTRNPSLQLARVLHQFFQIPLPDVGDTNMPAIKHFIVTQTRTVKVTANSALDALRIADAAFEWGQDANGGVAKDKAPEEVWGNTDSHIEITNVDVKLEN